VPESNGSSGAGEAPLPEEKAPSEAQAPAASDAQASAQEASPAELAHKVEQLRAMLDDSTSRAQQTQERLKDTHERLLRTAAEFDNFKKRTLKEKDDTRRFAIESLLKDFLPVADNLERALEHAEEHDPKQVIEGVRIVQKMLEGALAKHGVVGFSAVGQSFDPNLHEALMQQESDAPAGTVVSEMARGYKLHDRLVRPAAVVVARTRATPAGEPAPPGKATDAAGDSGGGPERK
jgi:molecular chaperone GrpE